MRNSLLCLLILLSLPLHAADQVLVDRKLLTYIDSNVEHHFQAAHQAFKRGDMRRSAQEIRQANAIMKLERANNPASVQAELDLVIGELHELARRIDSFQLNDDQAMRDLFARTHLVLAFRCSEKAQQAWLDQNPDIASQSLSHSLTHIEVCSIWSENPLPPSIQQDISESRRNLSQLDREKKGLYDTATDKTTRAAKWLGQHFKFGRLEKKSWE